MSVIYPDELIKNRFNSVQQKIDVDLSKDAFFLRKLKMYFNNYIGNSDSVKIDIINAKHNFENEIPLSFDLELAIADRGKTGKYILNCTATNPQPENYKIQIGFEKFIFITTNGVDGINISTFSKLLERFYALFEPKGEFDIDIQKTE